MPSNQKSAGSEHRGSKVYDQLRVHRSGSRKSIKPDLGDTASKLARLSHLEVTNRSSGRQSIFHLQQDRQYVELSQKFRLLRELPDLQPPPEFEEQDEKIDKEVRPPLDQRLQLVSIQEKNDLEKLTYFNHHVFLGSLRKKYRFIKG